MKQTVVFDFDGVIHSYKSGWMGANIIPDPPVPGIGKSIADIREAGYDVIVVSTRCATPEGYGAVRAWLIDHEIVVDDVRTEKPPAVVYIDDRAICFDGHPEKLRGRITAFKPWNKSSETNADRIMNMSKEESRNALIEYFSKWADIGDSYIFDLTRVKEAFAIGTMDFDDFTEWDEERIAMLVDEFLEWLQKPVEVNCNG